MVEVKFEVGAWLIGFAGAAEDEFGGAVFSFLTKFSDEAITAILLS